MINPQTRAEAKKMWQSIDHDLLGGVPVLSSREVPTGPERATNATAPRKPKHGPDNLYCKVHSRMVEHGG